VKAARTLAASWPADCDDGNPCTTDSCLLKHCSYTANTTPALTTQSLTADVCAGGSCTHPDNQTCECQRTSNCDDKERLHRRQVHRQPVRAHEQHVWPAPTTDGLHDGDRLRRRQMRAHTPDGNCPIGTASPSTASIPAWIGRAENHAGHAPIVSAAPTCSTRGRRRFVPSLPA